MAAIYKEVLINAPPEDVWAAVRDVGTVHERLVPGLVTDTRLEDGARVVTFANGLVARELIVALDEELRRFSYASVGGRAAHHNASMQVFPDGDRRSRLVWITDVLPDELAAPVGALMEQGVAIMRRTLAGESSRGQHASHASRTAECNG